MNQQNARRLKQKGTKSLAAWDFKSKDTPKEVPMAAFNNVPRRTDINGQDHMLAYIRPDEAQLLKNLGGAGTPGPGGIPQFGYWSDVWAEITSGGGGKNFGGEVFGSTGGALVDLNGDGYVTKAEADAAGGLPQNFISNISNASGATPLGSGLEPTGVAGALANYTIPGMIYTAARDNTNKFGYPGRPETSTNTDLDSVVGALSGQDAINAAVNSAVADTSVPYPQSADDVTVSTAAVDYGDEASRRRNIYGTGTRDYDRFTRGGGGYAFMPAYMRQFMTGEQFDVIAEPITLADGTTAYRTPDGKILSPEQFANTAQYENALTVDTPDQLKGYSITDAAGNVTYYTPDGQITSEIT